MYVLRPLLSPKTHSQIRKVTLLCIYDLLNLSSRRKDPEDVSDREQGKNKSLYSQIYHSFIHPSMLLPCFFFHFPLSLRSGLLIKKSSNQICV